MNFSEGTRRLALLAGSLGALAGGFGSYLELKSAFQQKAMHDRFERLASSDDVTKERKCRLLGGASGCSLIAEPKDDFADIAEPIHPPQHGHAFLAELDWNKMSRADQDKFLNSLNAKQQTKFAADMGWTKQSANHGNAPVDYDALAAKYGGTDDPYANLPDPTVPHWTPLASELNGKAIKTISWGEGKDYKVESIETEDGTALHAIPLPSRGFTYGLSYCR